MEIPELFRRYQTDFLLPRSVGPGKKSQVEKNSAGFIERWQRSNNTWHTHNVSMHQKRYDHCEDYPNSIYCEVDPDGDAFTEPLLCDGELCTIQHCNSGWQDSSAYDTCDSASETMGFSDIDVFYPKCSLSTRCENDDGDLVAASIDEKPFRMDDLRNCNGELKYV